MPLHRMKVSDEVYNFLVSIQRDYKKKHKKHLEFNIILDQTFEDYVYKRD